MGLICLCGEPNYITDLFKGMVSVDHIKGAIFISIFSFKFSLSFTVSDRINRIYGWCLGWDKCIGLGSKIYLVSRRQAHQINSSALPDKLNPSKTPTIYSLYINTGRETFTFTHLICHLPKLFI